MTTGRINQVAMLKANSDLDYKQPTRFRLVPPHTLPALTAGMRIAGEIAYQLLTVTLETKATHQSVTARTKARAIRFNPFHETLIKLPLAHSQHGSVSAAN